jgi:hypothetical protein
MRRKVCCATRRSTGGKGQGEGDIDCQAAAEKASESIIQVVTMQQPPADLLISITPGIRTLVEPAMFALRALIGENIVITIP